MGGERKQGAHGSMGQPFGGGKSNWKSNIWGDNLGGKTRDAPSVLYYNADNGCIL
jgi:hypothetical protein